MHKKFVLNIISRIVLTVCFFMLLPLGWAVYDDIHSQESKAFMFTIFLGMIVSNTLLTIFKIKKDETKKVNAKDGLAIVGLSWIILSAIGALPLYLSGVAHNFTDAYFEIVSGFTTTGATIFNDIEILPRGILFWRSLTHWLGGMGIIVLFIALLPALGTNASKLYKAEAPGITVERIEPRIKETAKDLWTVYFILSFLQTIFLMGGGMSFFDALCHTFGTVATGGFSTKNASIAAYDSYIQWIIIVFMLLAGSNFILHYLAIIGKPKAYFRDEEFRAYFIIVIVLIILFAGTLEINHLSFHPIRDAAFQIISLITTTGYVTADYEVWPNTLKFVLVMLMFIGGCGGSTGGGMKFIRFFLTIKIALRSIVQAVYPNAVIPIKFNAKPLPEKLIFSVLAFFMIFLHLIFLGGILFSITENCDLITAFTASVSAISNIGPGLGEIGATKNFAWISIPGKWLLIFLMLAGRLELYSILILFVPATWKK
ncbi:MAG: TrkH family potassium uptake protein [Candidatus Omnitrophica bacterium]|nr:TrkH family potassium uptake protein [Candidatus Omnitrophota bacterium]MCB9747111.1 TrkH family potassium uptake protein [Candidatus Omnitrophota bacterium]